MSGCWATPMSDRGFRGPGSPWPKPMTRRRVLSSAFGGALLVGAVGCGGNTGNEPTTVPTAELTPTPTQEAIGDEIASPIAGYLNPQRWVGRTLTVTSAGSSDYKDAQAEALLDPFAAATGATVQQKITDIGQLKNQVENGTVTWDVVDVPTEEVIPLSRADFLTPIDYRQVDISTIFPPEIAMQYGVGFALFSTVIAFPAGAAQVPTGWQDFWNVGAFGEGRALRKGPVGTLEFALIADGVAATRDALYPLDIPRAFASLNKIKPYVSLWYEDGKQPVELVVNQQVGLASAWNVRADLAEVRDAVALQWTGGMMSGQSWVVPRGTPNEDVAMDFINFATRAVPSANFARLVPFGPVNQDALALLRPDRRALLPSADPQRSLQFIENWNYWADNLEGLTEQFNTWLLQDIEPSTPET